VSGGRRLWIRFRQLRPGRAEIYGEAVAEAHRLATGHGAHFWAFEADRREGLIVEFLEGPSDAVLEDLDAKTEPSLAGGAGQPGKPAPAVEVTVGTDGLRCSEADVSD
jgi:hypothetical protein